MTRTDANGGRIPSDKNPEFFMGVRRSWFAVAIMAFYLRYKGYVTGLVAKGSQGLQGWMQPPSFLAFRKFGLCIRNKYSHIYAFHIPPGCERASQQQREGVASVALMCDHTENSI